MLNRDAPAGKLGHRAGESETNVLVSSMLCAQVRNCWTAHLLRMLAQLIGITRNRLAG
jgi:hypothetical protein